MDVRNIVRRCDERDKLDRRWVEATVGVVGIADLQVTDSLFTFPETVDMNREGSSRVHSGLKREQEKPQVQLHGWTTESRKPTCILPQSPVNSQNYGKGRLQRRHSMINGLDENQ